MRIAVDGRHLAAGRGVARYSAAMLEHLPGDVRVVPGSRAAFAAAALLGRPRLDRAAGGADVAWLPAPAPVAISRGVPVVLTVHDLSWERRPADFTPYERLWHRAARIAALARRAARVVCDTHAVAAEVRARWGIEPVVIHPGPGVSHVGRHHDRERARPPYLLAVGALEPRKEPELLARAYARARAAGLEAELVWAGSGRLAIEGARVVQAGDEELGALYAGALAVVHPASYEGFGFPPIEALAHGAPPVVADLPLYDETVGAGALRFPPGDEAGLADALLRIERDPALRERLVAAGREAIAPLSWERAARELHALLREVAR